MKIKPEERPTIIKLAVAISLVLLYALVRYGPLLLNGNKTEPAPTGVTTASLTTPAAGATTPGMVLPTSDPRAPSGTKPGNMPGSKVDMYTDTNNEPAITRDPFTPAVPAAELDSGRGDYSPPPRSVVPPPRMTVRTVPQGVLLPPLKPGPAPIVMPATGAAGFGAGTGEAQPPTVTLAGVIAGPQAVAVIHVGDRAYPLTSGEKLPILPGESAANALSLARITEDGIYVRQGKKMWFLEVGKPLSAAMPIKPGMQGFTAPGSMAPGSTSLPVRRLAAAEDAAPANTVEATSPTSSESVASPALTQP